jgi:multidrug efflux system membrane fusion protein
MIRPLWLGGLFLVLAYLASGCGPPAPPLAETPPPPVTVSQPVVRNVIDQDDYEGRITAAKTVEVRARVRGHLIKVNFEDGQMVKVGELLYEIDPRPPKAALDAAKAQEKAADASLQFAKAEYNRTRVLIPSGASSREELETWAAKQAVARGELLKAQAAVEQAQLDLDFTKITAPISGRISRTQVDVGNLVNIGGGESLLTTIVSVDPVYVYFNVDERSFIRYRKSHSEDVKANGEMMPVKELKIPVHIALEGEQDYPYKGVIDFADNRVNPSTGTIQVRGTLSNAKRLFEDGMRARVRIPVSDPHQSLLITERAVGSDQGRKFVYVVNAQNVVERRDVVPGRLYDGLLVIREGLKPDESILVNGIQRVRDGMTVKPQRVPMPGAERPAESTAPSPQK